MTHNGQIPKCPLKCPKPKKSPKMRQTVKIFPNGQNMGYCHEEASLLNFKGANRKTIIVIKVLF